MASGNVPNVRAGSGVVKIRGCTPGTNTSQTSKLPARLGSASSVISCFRLGIGGNLTV